MRLGVDVGGTFTDLLLHDPATGRTWEAKTPSTPEDQSIGVALGVRQICAKAGIDPADLALILHGTTVATNAVLEGKGARVGLLVTEGFEYMLHLAKSWTPGPLFGWIVMDKPTPLATLDDTRGIPERMNARGQVMRELDEAAAIRAIDDVCTSGIEALTISLLHSYANPDHERRLAQIVAERHPHIPVSLSSDILPEFREYDRTITTVMNDYVRPIMTRYLTRIEDRLAKDGVKAHLHIVRSDGGLMSARAAAERPVHTVLSGPAGGVTSTVMVARRTGLDLLAFDMGGTSTDVSVIIDGQPAISRATEVGMFPAKVPTLDVRSVGAGGGSIAEVNDLTKSLRVGPRSAGARPGPVCYSRGGTEPTVSDANAVLGYLPPVLLGGDMSLDVPAAKAAVADIGRRLGLSSEDAALGILQIANEVMLGALRVITVQRGLDPRDFGILAFGGAGPLHACDLADSLAIRTILIPPFPGVLSAYGMLVADVVHDASQSVLLPASALMADPTPLAEQARQLADQVTAVLVADGIPAPDLTARLDLRYSGQSYELTVPLPLPVDADALAAAMAAFHAAHAQRYGYAMPDEPVTVVTLRVVGRGPGAQPTLPRLPEQAGAATPVGHDAVWFRADGPTPTPRYARADLAAGATLPGPALVAQYDATTLITPGWVGRVDELGNLWLHREDA